MASPAATVTMLWALVTLTATALASSPSSSSSLVTEENVSSSTDYKDTCPRQFSLYVDPEGGHGFVVWPESRPPQRHRDGNARLNDSLVVEREETMDAGVKRDRSRESWDDKLRKTIKKAIRKGDVISEPLCFSKGGELKTRRCVAGRGWRPRDPPEECRPIPPPPPAGDDAPLPCPPPYVHVPGTDGKLCLWVAAAAPWEPVCLRTGTTDSLVELDDDLREAALEELRRRNATSVWLPGRRATRFGPMLRLLPGRRWLDVYPDLDEYDVSIRGWELQHDCLVMETSVGSVGTADCAERMPAACVLLPEEEDHVMQLACPDGSFTSKYNVAQDRCFSVRELARGALPFEAALRDAACAPAAARPPLARALLRYLLPHLSEETHRPDDEERCWSNVRLSDPGPDIRLESANAHSAAPATATLAPPEYPVNVVSAWGNVSHLMSGHALRCLLCETDAVPPAPTEMALRHDPRRQRLLLSVYGGAGLWRESDSHYGFRCFTNAKGYYDKEVKVRDIWRGHWTVDNLDEFMSSGESGRRPVLDLDVEKTLYEVEVEEHSSGHYWCEGHAVATFRRVRSNVAHVHGETPGFVYALAVDVDGGCHLDSKDCDPTFPKEFEDVAKKIRKLLDEEVESVRFMRVLDVAANGSVRLALHVVPASREASPQRDIERVGAAVRAALQGAEPTLRFRSLLSTEGCAPAEEGGLRWGFAPLGATAVPRELCLGADGLPVSRRCRGDFVRGGQWGPATGDCAPAAHRASTVTRALHEIAEKDISSMQHEGHSFAANVSALTADPRSLTPADVFYTARAVRNLAYSGAFGDTLSKEAATAELRAVSEIVNHISLASDKAVSLVQQRLNASNMLLDAVDLLFDRISSSIEDVDDDDVLLAVTPFVLIQVTDLRKSNVTGLALLRRDSEDSDEPPTDFTKYEVVHLESTERLETVLEYDDLEVAVWAPHNLVDYVFNTSVANDSWFDPQPNTSSPLRVVISLFYKDLTFYNTTEEVADDADGNGTSTANATFKAQTKVGSRIVSFTIPGFSQSLPVPIPIIFRPLLEEARSRECAFWDFAYNSSTAASSMGGWSGEGCVYAGNSSIDAGSQLDVCMCTHLTHFAELLGGRYVRISLAEDVTYEDIVSIDAHNKALDAITLMGCCLSLFGITGIIVTAIAFRSWRQKPGSKILLQLSAALACQIILLMVSGTIHTSKDEAHTCHVTKQANKTVSETCDALPGRVDAVCVALGALLHYFSLAAFTWMFVTALLQFMRYVRIVGPTRPPRFFLKSLLFGWGAPLVPVALLAAISPESYVQPTLCYPSGVGLYTAVLVPILIFLAMNFYVFVMVVNSIIRGPDGKVRSNPERKLLISQLKLSVLLFFLLGLSWLFGLLVVSGAGLVFSYLFCIAATLQGFVMFVFFVACDPATRKLWQATFGSWSDLLLMKIGNTESSADLTSSVSNIHREPTTETSDTI